MTAPPESSPPGTSAWRWAWRSLWCVVLLTGALNVLRIRGGFLTSHCADLAVPALLYVTTRRYPVLTRSGKPLILRRLVGTTAETAALWIFTASAATEISQRYWPHGVFPGTFDPLDILAYVLSVGFCYLADKLELRRAGKRLNGASDLAA